METKSRYKWEGGEGEYAEGECDIPECHNKPNIRNWEKDALGFNGDDECVASLCNEHKEYKKYSFTKDIVSAYKLQAESLD